MTFSSRRIRVAAVVLRVALGAVFVYAAWLKLPWHQPWQLFAGAIGDYKILPDWAIAPLARTLPWLELLLGLMLVAGVGLRIAATGVTALLAVFFSLMVRAYAQGMEISCGCFGPGEVISWKTLLRDGSLLVAGVVVTWWSFARPRREEART